MDVTIYVISKVLFDLALKVWFSIEEYVQSYIWASTREKLLPWFGNNKGADQPAHPRSLISTFVTYCKVAYQNLLQAKFHYSI